MNTRKKIAACLLGGWMLAGCVTTTKDGDTFSRNALFYGSSLEQSACQKIENAVWVTADGNSECIRYFSNNLKPSNPIALAFFHGDVGSVNFYSNIVLDVPNFYSKYTKEKLTTDARLVGDQVKIPYIAVSRPGIFGSTGNHGNRYMLLNKKLMNAALDAIKIKHKIGHYALAGQSGGGTVVAALLTMRDDIRCAALASSAGSVKESMMARSPGRNLTVYGDYVYDPYDHINKIKNDPTRTIYVIADKNDQVVKHWAQKSYFDAIKDFGHRAFLLNGKARGTTAHGMAKDAISVADRCATGTNSVDIVNEYRSMQPNSFPKVENTLRWPSGPQTRQIEISWKGYPKLGELTAIMNHTGKGGTLAVTFPDSRGECKGTYGLGVNGAGNWFLECSNGLTASGALNANSWEKPSKATGIDNRSRLVVYQILPINL